MELLCTIAVKNTLGGPMVPANDITSPNTPGFIINDWPVHRDAAQVTDGDTCVISMKMEEKVTSNHLLYFEALEINERFVGKGDNAIRVMAADEVHLGIDHIPVTGLRSAKGIFSFDTVSDVKCH